MDVSTALSAVQTILTAIQTLCQIQALSNCKRELEDLQKTVRTVKAVLGDAEAKQDPLNCQEEDYILELKDAVYDADDVMDEFLTLDKQKQLTHQAGDNKVSNKVKSLLSRFKNLKHNLSGKVKKVNTKLDAIATKSSKFCFKFDYKPVMFSKKQTSSLCDKNIVGREKDVEKIVGMLLGSDDVDLPDVSFVSIVGMRGLGKTAVAQLVYNDPRITNAFQLKCWTCIADDPKRWNVEELLGKVVRELNKDRAHFWTTLEQMHHEARKQLGGKKYLLVLDDVWTESRHNWEEFEKFLMVGLRGSRVVVTTRSKETAKMVVSGQGQVHELQGLSKTESWRLFEKMAFLPQQRDADLVKLGKKIVEKCSNVPLAIRVVASLLQGQHKNMWLSFHDNELAKISQSNDTMRSMTNILKISYHQLEPALKTCFAYCAIFPKDFEIPKECLIHLWMAQGYINTEDVGEEYILTLLQRCFFQDVYEDKYGEIYSFKMHDLLHDIAQQVAGDEICRRLTPYTLIMDKRFRQKQINKERLIQLWMAQGYINTEDMGEEYFLTLLESCVSSRVYDDKYGEIFKLHDLLDDIAEQVAVDEMCRLNSNTLNMGKRVRHVSHFYYYHPPEINKTDIRTYLTFHIRSFKKEKLRLSRQWFCFWTLDLRGTCLWSLDLRGQWTRLWSLDLRGLDVENLPESLGNLLHLRFLNLAGCTKLKVLPKAITKLVNLQTLNLDGCVALKELPNKVNKLADLRILNLTHCNALSRMPSDIGMLTSLHTNGVMIGETVILSGTCSFATSNDDDSSSTTMSIISPNGGCMINISHWEKGKLLGKGSFGTVYEGITSEGNFIAVKEVSLLEQGSQGRQSIYQLEQEIELLSQFEHENIVRYLGTDKADSKHYIFLELVTQGSLASLYKKYRLLDSQVSAYTKQILMGLKYLHDRNVVHRDIKCANILVASNGKVKLADFGLAKATRLNDLMSCKGTAFWMAPEVVYRKNQGYGLAADIWSLGCTVLEMLTRHYPYHPLEFQQALFRIGNGELPSIPDSLSADARDFIQQCLRVNADDRPTAAELLDHQFL